MLQWLLRSGTYMQSFSANKACGLSQCRQTFCIFLSHDEKQLRHLGDAATPSAVVVVAAQSREPSINLFSSSKTSKSIFLLEDGEFMVGWAGYPDLRISP
uniref:Uncharacterized protein n=1 Tax=Romanomermis culicivorax TaxID=13658 RepID=A0A915ICJ4_ROMCU